MFNENPSFLFVNFPSSNSRMVQFCEFDMTDSLSNYKLDVSKYNRTYECKGNIQNKNAV